MKYLRIKIYIYIYIYINNNYNIQFNLVSFKLILIARTLKSNRINQKIYLCLFNENEKEKEKKNLY